MAQSRCGACHHGDRIVRSADPFQVGYRQDDIPAVPASL
jgi:hypothetical protein